jgi:hypothetical protein
MGSQPASCALRIWNNSQITKEMTLMSNEETGAAEAAALAGDSETIPFEVTDEINPDEVGDLTEVKRDDTIPASRGVLFIVHKASVDVRVDKTEDGGTGAELSKVLRIQAKIADRGINDKGDFAGKILFVDLPLVLKLDAMKARHDRIQARLAGEGKVKTPKPFNEKWHTDSKVDFKEFALATGLAEMREVEGQGVRWAMTGPINDELLKMLSSGDVAFVGDVSRRENTGMNRFENKVSNFKAPEPVAE